MKRYAGLIATVLFIVGAFAFAIYEDLATAHEPRSGHWPVVRAAHLAKQPECQACGGREELTVHHIKPFEYYPELELEPSNLLTLCSKHHCHFSYGHAYSWRAWNPNVVEDAKHARKMIEQRKYER